MASCLADISSQENLPFTSTSLYDFLKATPTVLSWVKISRIVVVGAQKCSVLMVTPFTPES